MQSDSRCSQRLATDLFKRPECMSTILVVRYTTSAGLAGVRVGLGPNRPLTSGLFLMPSTEHVPTLPTTLASHVSVPMHPNAPGPYSRPYRSYPQNNSGSPVATT